MNEHHERFQALSFWSQTLLLSGWHPGPYMAALAHGDLDGVTATHPFNVLAGDVAEAHADAIMGDLEADGWTRPYDPAGFVVRTPKYAGRHAYTIRGSDIGRTWFRIDGHLWMSPIGTVQSGDVGKWVMVQRGVLQVENNEQRDSRLGLEGVPPVPHLAPRDSEGW